MALGRHFGGMRVDPVRHRGRVDEFDGDLVALTHAQHRPRRLAVVGPCVVGQAQADLDALVLDRKREGFFPVGASRGRRSKNPSKEND